MQVCNVFTHRFAFHPLGGQRAWGDGRTTAKSFEPGIHNLPQVIHLNLRKVLTVTHVTKKNEQEKKTNQKKKNPQTILISPIL